MPDLTILGGGNTAFSVAAHLTLEGHRVALWEIPSFSASLGPVRESRVIHLLGAARTGPAKVHRVTTDIGEALAFSRLVLVVVPSYAHLPFVEACAPHLSGHTVVLVPGNLGTLEWARVLRERGVEGVTLAEVDTAPYVCRKTAPDTATIWGVVTGLGLGVLPSSRTSEVRERLDPLFPGVVIYPSVVACGLAAMNPVVHPAGVLMNAGRVEHSKGEFYFYEEGVTPGVVKVITRVDDERRAVARALGYDLIDAAEAYYRAGFSPRGDLWAAINGSRMLTQLRAPGVLGNRWLTEDIPYGIASWASLGAHYGVATPTLDALVTIGSIVMGSDGKADARDVRRLGVEGMSVPALTAYLETGRVG
jgi:opine dehydrogenase